MQMPPIARNFAIYLMKTPQRQPPSDDTSPALLCPHTITRRKAALRSALRSGKGYANKPRERLSARPLHSLRFGSLVAAYEFVIDELAFLQRLVAVTHDGGVMHKDVLSCVLEDESESSLVVEPFHFSAGHN
jgi:hypothetical protein